MVKDTLLHPLPASLTGVGLDWAWLQDNAVTARTFSLKPSLSALERNTSGFCSQVKKAASKGGD